jgi:translation elongation factor EF-1alpha
MRKSDCIWLSIILGHEQGGFVVREKIGKVTHYFDRIGVAVLTLSGELKVGDSIHILGHTTDFEQAVSSMEIDHKKVQSVGPGDDVALRVAGIVRKGDDVYRVSEE